MICTSGTAVANLHPAMLEAAHAGVPLVAVTADRPARLRGTGANQTTDQVGIFGPLVPTYDVAAAGVVRATCALVRSGTDVTGYPSISTSSWTSRWCRRTGGRSAGGRRANGRRGWRPAAASADPSPARPAHGRGGRRRRRSARAGAGRAGRLAAAGRADQRLAHRRPRDPHLPAAAGRRRSADEVERVVVLGHPTLSRPVTRLLAREDVEVWSPPSPGVWSSRPVPGRRAARPATVGEQPGRHRLARALARGRRPCRPRPRRAAGRRARPHAVRGRRCGRRALPPGGLLVVGASNPIRDLDLMVPRYEVGGRRKVIANRGLSGIDGTVSTAIGAALGRPTRPARLALVGDVTFLHDTNGLVLGPDEPEPDLTIVVVNDDGGSIFATLEQGADRVRRPLRPAVRHAPRRRPGQPLRRHPHPAPAGRPLPELEQALASPNGGIEVVEAVVRRDNRRALDARIRALAAD